MLIVMVAQRSRARLESPETAPPDICPRCAHRHKLVYLKFMRLHNVRDWFKCDHCDYIFTTIDPPDHVPASIASRSI